MCKVQLKFAHKKTQENTMVRIGATQKYIHIYTSVLSSYASDITYKWVGNFLDSIHQQSIMRVCLRIVLVLC
jgi:hypothetical protein